MDEDELILTLVIIILLGIFAIALIAGNIVEELLAPIPFIAGPLSTAVSLTVFVFLIGKGAKVAFS